MSVPKTWSPWCRVLLACLVASVVAACGAPRETTTLKNREAGLSLKYPANWRYLDREGFGAEMKRVFPGWKDGGSQHQGVIFALVGENSSGRAPNFIVSAIGVTPDDCLAASTSSFISEVARQSGAYFKESSAIFIGRREVGGVIMPSFTIEIPSGGRTVTHRRDYYCHDGSLVQLESSASDEIGNRDIASITSSIEWAEAGAR